MALAPTAAAPPADDTGAPAPDDTGVDEAAPEAAGDTVLVTICKSPDGTYMVYKGDEPEEGEGDDGGGAEGAAGDAGEAGGGGGAGLAGNAGAAGDVSGGGAEPSTEGAPQGEHCDTVGAALKATMTILHDDESGGEGGAEGAFQSGFAGAPADGMPPLAQKY